MVFVADRVVERQGFSPSTLVSRAIVNGSDNWGKGNLVTRNKFSGSLKYNFLTFLQF